MFYRSKYTKQQMDLVVDTLTNEVCELQERLSALAAYYKIEYADGEWVKVKKTRSTKTKTPKSSKPKTTRGESAK